MDEISTIRVGPIDQFNSLPPVRKLVFLVLLLALKDRASQVFFESGPGVNRLLYLVDNEWHELVPPPDVVIRRIGIEIRGLIHPDRRRREWADRLRRYASGLDPQLFDQWAYRFQFQFGTTETTCEATFQSRDEQHRVYFHICNADPSASEISRQFLSNILAVLTELTEEELNEPWWEKP